jgi:molybdopterin-binding protein
VITNDSFARLGLKAGTLITAEVKAPMVILQKWGKEPKCSAENMFQGTIARIIKGKVTTGYVVKIADGTQLCSLVPAKVAADSNLAKTIRSGPYSIALLWYCILTTRDSRDLNLPFLPIAGEAFGA